MTVRCGHKTHDLAVAKIHHHESVEMVRLCFSLEYGAYSLEDMAPVSEDELYDQQRVETDAEERMAALFADI